MICCWILGHLCVSATEDFSIYFINLKDLHLRSVQKIRISSNSVPTASITPSGLKSCGVPNTNLTTLGVGLEKFNLQREILEGLSWIRLKLQTFISGREDKFKITITGGLRKKFQQGRKLRRTNSSFFL